MLPQPALGDRWVEARRSPFSSAGHTRRMDCEPHHGRDHCTDDHPIPYAGLVVHHCSPHVLSVLDGDLIKEAPLGGLAEYDCRKHPRCGAVSASMGRCCSARCSAVAGALSPLFARAMMARKDSMISSVFMAYLPGSFRDHIEKDHRAKAVRNCGNCSPWLPDGRDPRARAGQAQHHREENRSLERR
jgi:hypothetical protein